MEDEIERFLKRHSTALREISERLPSLFEGLCLVYIAQYYETNLGYRVKPKNLFDGLFKLKYGTTGYPDNYSFFEVTKGKLSFEIHHNLPVQGARDENVIYVADAAIIVPGMMEKKVSFSANGRKRVLHFCPNKSLKTFAEVKHLIAYSMLIAQFIGVVFEIKPRCLIPSRIVNNIARFKNHIFPSLLVSGASHIGADSVIESLGRRNYAIAVACNLLQSPASLREAQSKLRSLMTVTAI